MCNGGCIGFGATHLTEERIRDKDVLECGAFDVNGSVHPHVAALGPRRFEGIDIAAHPYVTRQISVYDLVQEFGEESFDVVFSTEMMEHVEDWRKAIYNMKRVCRKGGYILITTRSKGFGLHSYPQDWWRFEKEDMETIFSDCEIIAIEKDSEPGIFVFVRKPLDYVERPLEDIKLYNINTDAIE